MSKTEPTFSQCEKFINLMNNEDPQCMDEMVKLMGEPVEVCYRIYDFISLLANKVINTDTFLSVTSIKNQLAIVDKATEHLAEIVEANSYGEHGMTLKDLVAAIKANLETSMKLKKEMDVYGSKAKSEEAIAYALTELLKAIRGIDPIVSVKVRDGVVKQLDPLVAILPVMPGKD